MSTRRLPKKLFTNAQNNPIISLIESQDVNSALIKFERFRNQGLKPTLITYSKIIHAFAKQGFVQKAEDTFQLMQDDGYSPNVIIYSSLINAFAQQKNMIKARSVLDEMKSNNIPRNNVVYNTLIRGYCDCDMISEAEDLIQQMYSENIPRDSFTYNTILNGFTKSGNIEKALEYSEKLQEENIKWDVYTFSTLIKGYCKSGNIPKALELLDDMENNGFTPNVVVYSTIIGACAQSNQMEYAEKILEHMVSKDIEPNFRTYTSMIYGYANQGQFDDAWRVFDEILVKGYHPDDVLFTSLITACATRQRMNDIPKILDTMKRYDIKITPLIQNTIAGGYASVGDIAKCKEIIDSIYEKKQTVYQKTIQTLLRAYVANNEVQIAKNLFNSMDKKYKCPLDVISCNIIIKGFALEGKDEKIFDIYDKMLDNGIHPSVGTFLYWFYSNIKHTTAMNIEAVFREAKSKKIYISRETSNLLIESLLDSDKSNESIQLCMNIIKYLQFNRTPTNNATFSKILPYIIKNGTASQRASIMELKQKETVDEQLFDKTNEERERLRSFSISELENYTESQLFENIDNLECAVGLLRQKNSQISHRLSESIFRATIQKSSLSEAQYEFTLLREEGYKPSSDLFDLLRQRRNDFKKKE